MSESIVGSPKVELTIFVLKRFYSRPLMNSSVTVWNKYSVPLMERVELRIAGKVTQSFEGSVVLIVRTASKIGEGPFIAVFYGLS